MIQFLEYKGITKNKFYVETGISNGTLDKVSGLSLETVEKFYNVYPEINPDWLITGKGEMIKSEKNLNIISNNRKTKDGKVDEQEIPLYDFEATAGLKDLFNSDSPRKVLDTIKIPNIPKCDGAISVTGDSMYPLLKSGDIVLYKQVAIEDVFFGEMYLLSIQLNEWEEYITVKYVQKSDKGDEYVKLVSQNGHHQPKDVLTKSITAIALIKASIRINTMM
ncbi:helix-turn-helix transcriptional regulator [Paenimyroides baculatum]|uniref:Helix-turn-helix transcriptional regulator n=1 Tax=Paenimyroides baculatum TaxID=2608000 RepID=A0A5M6CFT3_9FLAO|nr:helix-turn-helix transcriptional regulator [Paenimyroides baculatum]